MCTPAVCVLKGVVFRLRGTITTHPRSRGRCGMANLFGLFMDNIMSMRTKGYQEVILSTWRWSIIHLFYVIHGDGSISADQGNFSSPPVVGNALGKSKKIYALRYRVFWTIYCIMMSTSSRFHATYQKEMLGHCSDFLLPFALLAFRAWSHARPWRTAPTVDTTCVEEQTHFSQALLHLRHYDSGYHGCLKNSVVLVPARLIISQPNLFTSTSNSRSSNSTPSRFTLFSSSTLSHVLTAWRKSSMLVSRMWRAYNARKSSWNSTSLKRM